MLMLVYRDIAAAAVIADIAVAVLVVVLNGVFHAVHAVILFGCWCLC